MSIDPDYKIKMLDGYDENGLDLHWVFTFGKHKGKLLHLVIRQSPEYVFWCMDNVGWFKLNLKALKFCLKWECIKRGEKGYWEVSGGSFTGK